MTAVWRDTWKIRVVREATRALHVENSSLFGVAKSAWRKGMIEPRTMREIVRTAKAVLKEE